MHHRVLTHNRNHRRKQPTYGIVPLVRVAIAQGALIQQKSPAHTLYLPLSYRQRLPLPARYIYIYRIVATLT